MCKRLVVSSVLLLGLVLIGACAGTPVPAERPAGSAALVVKGQVAEELNLSLDDLEALGLEQITAEHPKEGPQDYEGVRLNVLLDWAQVQGGASKVVLRANDGYSAEAALADVQSCADCLVFIEDDGTLSLVMPGLSSKVWVRELVSIEIK